MSRKYVQGYMLSCVKNMSNLRFLRAWDDLLVGIDICIYDVSWGGCHVKDKGMVCEL